MNFIFFIPLKGEAIDLIFWSNMGAKNNQKFVQIPTAKLKERIAQLCSRYGIKFIETEEFYTSQSSFLDDDELPKYGEKPDGWQHKRKKD
ncbi:hypothetical protein CYANOKiyG1_08640 [Okeania sp. KiyG1]|nr:hypothetical protein CYANOKiyG1_08640 [Okeania sp. KiyG1]